MESSQSSLCDTFQTKPSKAIKIVPVREANSYQASQSFAATDTQVQAIVYGTATRTQEVQNFAIV